MNRAIPKILSVLFLALSVTACDSGGDDADPTLDGNWSGTTVVGTSSIQMTVNLVENNRVINGSGTLVIGGNFAVTVTGTHNYPNVTLTITDGIDTLSFTGTVAGGDNSITGSLTGGGLTGTISFTLSR